MGRLCPIACGQVKEGDRSDQLSRQSLDGTSVPFSVRAPAGAHRCLPIMAQDFSPGRPCVQAGYYWEEMVRRFAPVLVSGLKSAAKGHPCPVTCGPVKEGEVYDHSY